MALNKIMVVGSFLVLLAGCAKPLENPDVRDEQTTAAGDEGSLYAGDCAGITGTAPVIDAEDRDQWGTAGLDLEAMDTRFEAGDDFFCFVNGAWYANFTMPEDKTRYGSFALLADKSEARVKKIIEELAVRAPDPDTLEGKVAAFYSAYLDSDGIDKRGLAPAQSYLQQIQQIKNRTDLAEAFGTLGFASPLVGWVDIDSKDTENYIFYITQSGLGLPDRDIYLSDDGENKATRAGYLKYLTVLLVAAGYEEPDVVAARVLALETDIARAHWDRAVGRNRNLTYNKITLDELLELGEGFPLEPMLQKLQLAEQAEFVVRELNPSNAKIAELGLDKDQVEKISGGGVSGILSLMVSADLADWQAYLTAHFLSDHAAVLPKAIDHASFEFYAKQLRGQEQQRPRWKRAVSAVESSLGEAVGSIYAARYFPPENKRAMDALVKNLRLAMADNLDELAWMSDATKVAARDKLKKFTPKIGYAEKFATYDSLPVGSHAFENTMAANRWAYDDMIGQLGQPIDRTEWFMLPQTVNAYYSPNRNEIVFPAAILQPPFFNIAADAAINYGAIGAVIGHELGHGFDDQGSKSDGDGVLRNWWSDADRQAFEDKTDALVGQYDAFCPLDGGDTCINGRLGLGENSGDLGGLSMALKAYKMSLDGNGDGHISADEQAPVIGGYTGEQRFFMAWAQAWRSKYREQALRQQLIRGPHSPPYYRVNGVVRNFDEWYEAFDVDAENALYLPPSERIRIW